MFPKEINHILDWSGALFGKWIQRKAYNEMAYNTKWHYISYLIHLK